MAGKTITVNLKFMDSAMGEDEVKLIPQIANFVLDFFTGSAKSVKAISDARITTAPTSGAVRDFDVVCYVVGAQKNSIIARRFGVSPTGTSTGNTSWNPETRQMISEVYLDKMEGDAQRARLIANIICHELMHNKLDTYPDKMAMSDIHAIKDGSVSKEKINASDTPSDADMAAMAKGLAIVVPQHTLDI